VAICFHAHLDKTLSFTYELNNLAGLLDQLKQKKLNFNDNSSRVGIHFRWSVTNQKYDSLPLGMPSRPGSAPRTSTRPSLLDSPCTPPVSFGWLFFPSSLLHPVTTGYLPQHTHTHTHTLSFWKTLSDNTEDNIIVLERCCPLNVVIHPHGLQSIDNTVISNPAGKCSGSAVSAWQTGRLCQTADTCPDLTAMWGGGECAYDPYTS